MDVATLISQAQQVAGRVDSAFQERTIRFLNEAVEQWALARPWSGLKKTIELPSTGSNVLVFPDYVRMVKWIADKTNQNTIDYAEDWDRQVPGTYLADTAGAPSWWRDGGVLACFRQPSTTATITVQSTVSEVFSVALEGIGLDTSASGTAAERYVIREIVTSSAGVGYSTKQYAEILSVGKRRTTGDVTVLAGSDTLARIAADRYTTPYRAVELLRIPPAGTIIRAGVILTPPQILDTNQVPHPSINVQYLIWYAAGLIHKAQNEGDQARSCLAQAEAILNRRDYQEQAHADRDWGSRPDPLYWSNEDSWQPL